MPTVVGIKATAITPATATPTAMKEHIQKMTTQNDNLLKVVRKQEAQIDKQQTQIDELLKQNGQLINKIGNNTNTGGPTSAGAENSHRGRYQGNRNNTGNRNTNSNERDRTLQMPTATEQKTSPSAPFAPFVHTRRLIVGNWIKTRAKDLITGRRCSNDTRRGQLTIKIRG